MDEIRVGSLCWTPCAPHGLVKVLALEDEPPVVPRRTVHVPFLHDQAGSAAWSQRPHSASEGFPRKEKWMSETASHDPTAPIAAVSALQSLTTRAPQLAAQLERLRPQLERELARTADATLSLERLFDLLVLAFEADPDLLRCTVSSLVKGVVKTVRQGLVLGEDCHLVPFKQEAVWMPEYGGLAKKLLATGTVAKVGAEAVYQRDHFVCDYLRERYEHEPHRGDRGELVGAYGLIVLKPSADIVRLVTTLTAELEQRLGALVQQDAAAVERAVERFAQALLSGLSVRYVHYMERKDIDRVRKSSRAGSREESAWSRHYDEMARKSAFKNLCKWCKESAPALTAALTAVLEEEPLLETLPPTPAQAQQTLAEVWGQEPAAPPAQEPPEAERVTLLNRVTTLWQKELGWDGTQFYGWLREHWHTETLRRLPLAALRTVAAQLEAARGVPGPAGAPEPGLPFDVAESARRDRTLAEEAGSSTTP